MERVLSLQTLSESNDPVGDYPPWSTISMMCSGDSMNCSSASNACGSTVNNNW